MTKFHIQQQHDLLPFDRRQCKRKEKRQSRGSGLATWKTTEPGSPQSSARRVSESQEGRLGWSSSWVNLITGFR